MSAAEGADDLTRKQRREQARDQRRAIEEAQRAQAARKRRLAQLGGALAIAVVVVVVAIVLSSSGSKSKSPGIPSTPRAKSTVVTAVEAALAGIPQSGNTLGNPKAPVTMQYYGDLECPICQSFTLATMPSVISGPVKAGKVQVKYVSLQTATPDQATFQKQQVAALAAGKQNKMWDYLELFYREQGAERTSYVTDAYLQGLAQQVPGLNLATWQAARGDGALTQQVSSDAQTAGQSGFNSTPTVVVRGPHGAKAVAGDVPYGTIASMISGVS